MSRSSRITLLQVAEDRQLLTDRYVVFKDFTLTGKTTTFKFRISPIFFILSSSFFFAIFSSIKLIDLNERVSEPKTIKDIEICTSTAISVGPDLCPLVSNQLTEFKWVNLEVNVTYLKNMPAALGIKPGGRWSPQCTSLQKVAVIVPYRGRKKQLEVFLQHMHPFLQSQLIDYGIFVIEQSQDLPFNRGQLLNIGFLEASEDHGSCCFFFHDVDLLPINPQNMYICSNNPRHVCPSIDVHRYKLLYPKLFGGVVAFKKEHFINVNGFSNSYFGWGGEDDDMHERLVKKGISFIRWRNSISQCVMLYHKKATPNPNRYEILETAAERIFHDGFNTSKYKVLERHYKPLYTHILVSLQIDAR